MNRVSFTSYAMQDLGEIYRYIAQDTIEAADKHSQRLQARWRALLDQPRIGTKRDDVEPGLRSVSEGNYVIYYRILSTGIEIVRVLHGSRDANKAFAEAGE